MEEKLHWVREGGLVALDAVVEVAGWEAMFQALSSALYSTHRTSGDRGTVDNP